jgi:hypothetical protein
MAICMRLYLAHQSDFFAFSRAPRTLGIWLRSPHALPDVLLGEAWHDIDALLTGATAAPSQLRAEGGDWTYPAAADHGAHAISAATTQRLLESVQQIDRPKVAAYVRRRWVLQAFLKGEASELAPGQLAAMTDELLGHVTRLREACELAVRKGYGILMALWEEGSEEGVRG